MARGLWRFDKLTTVLARNLQQRGLLQLGELPGWAQDGGGVGGAWRARAEEPVTLGVAMNASAWSRAWRLVYGSSSEIRRSRAAETKAA